MSRYNLHQTTVPSASTGPAGHRPTVMIGSIFFRGQRLVLDAEQGLFDARAARDLLQQEEELARTYSLPRIIDVIGETPLALRRYLDFVAENSQEPLMLDAVNRPVRMQVLKELKGSPLIQRIIYNSLDERMTEEELALLEECGVRRVVVLALGNTAVRPRDRLDLLDGPNGLLAKLQARGFDIMIDAGVLDLTSIGWAALTIARAKERWNLPVGCAPCNGFYLWMRENRPSEAVRIATATAALTLPLAWGADFLFYGSLANAPWVYPAVQAAGSMLAYADREMTREKRRAF
ncbi:tetrahydromethanopterin S-methyltransferase subunit H [Thermanaeromonas sp. C210]|uniref:tetrahydromethanopterin S-methyltransferase subunit H n=1 Tax=Thermanaeromonas sp. C210 TaxID=2731925 RepID=UPI00155BA9DC|nr:tetrahydromethanopterin S-methyltransferase subunit H [Thermanaeromonas sp. C210]GFN22652.1 tetrahydromethanopterin S-methyltransferase subunit H [Thermanaeromonas sp. C210]